ncbi:MAG TPA: shikimate dehydrogenase [Steroidobacteraceae bacterium]|nr:shikimate dehydrogenase [Steroidobacteraceae bacterium]
MTQNSPAEYGVIGHPVAHSRSPFIHGFFARESGQNMVYRMHDVAPERLQTFVIDFWKRGGRGLNVTVPHKINAGALVREMSQRAARAGAVNTLLMDAHGITGDNTDGAGLVRDLTQNLKVIVNGSRILLVGSGGAARGVVGPLLDESPAVLVITGRSAQRADALASQFETFGAVAGCGLDAIPAMAFDLIINATSAGLAGEVPALPGSAITAATFCYDMSYGSAGTAFLTWAREQGCVRSAQGWGMLVEQAAESFELWRGVRPATAAVLAALQGGKI